MIAIYLIFGVFMLISWIIGNKLKSKITEYSAIPIELSGKQIAEKMLYDNGIYDVKVISTEGELTDHYNPVTKTVNLSNGVYNGHNIASAAVSAHECGHAVQHKKAYAWLNIRSSLVPIVSVSSRYLQWVLLAGILLINVFPQLLLIGIIGFALTTLFAFITLPVEFDATRRGLAWLDTTGIVRGEKHEQAADALKWAALTYVVAALASLATLIYYIMIYMGGSRRNN